MKKYENELLDVFEEIKNQTIITFKDLDKIIFVISRCSNKISQQRSELEQSRDIQKSRAEKAEVKLKSLKMDKTTQSSTKANSEVELK